MIDEPFDETAWLQIGHSNGDGSGYVWTAPAGTPPPYTGRTSGGRMVNPPEPTPARRAAVVDELSRSVFGASRLSGAVGRPVSYGSTGNEPADQPGFWHGPAKTGTTVEFGFRMTPGMAELFTGPDYQTRKLRDRLNLRWKYRIDPGQPDDVRQYLHGAPEPEYQMVVATMENGNSREGILLRSARNQFAFYPAHPKGTHK